MEQTTLKYYSNQVSLYRRSISVQAGMSCSYWAWYLSANVDGISTLSPKKINCSYVELNEKGTFLKCIEVDGGIFEHLL